MPLHAETLAHLFYSGPREGRVVNDPNPPILLRGNGTLFVGAALSSVARLIDASVTARGFVEFYLAVRR